MSQFASAKTNSSRTGDVRAISQYNPQPTANEPEGQSEYSVLGLLTASLQEAATLILLTPQSPIAKDGTQVIHIPVTVATGLELVTLT